MNQETNQSRKYLYGHTSPESAYVVEDYPWGFRLRTTIRYWIETKEAKNGGQRFCSQTINPKTGKWCEPKKSTYSHVILMFLDENEHVKTEHITMYAKSETIRSFVEFHREQLSEFQKAQLKELLAINEVMKHVTFEVRPYSSGSVSLLSQDPEDIKKRESLAKEQEEREKEKEITLKRINFAIGIERRKVIL